MFFRLQEQFDGGINPYGGAMSFIGNAPGFLGCDIFILLSGCSLGYSYLNHSLKKIYLRRLIRIYPLFLILALSKCFFSQLSGETLSFGDWISTCTFLSYYGWGGNL